MSWKDGADDALTIRDDGGADGWTTLSMDTMAGWMICNGGIGGGWATSSNGASDVVTIWNDGTADGSATCNGTEDGLTTCSMERPPRPSGGGAWDVLSNWSDGAAEGLATE